MSNASTYQRLPRLPQLHGLRYRRGDLALRKHGLELRRGDNDPALHKRQLRHATFRHILLMGYGQVKHSMESGDKQRAPVIFISGSGHTPWCWAADPLRSKTGMVADQQGPHLCAVDVPGDQLAEPPKALEAAKPVTIDVKAEDEGESLELVNPPPEDLFIPPPHTRERDRPPRGQR